MLNFCPNCGKKLMKEDPHDRCPGCGARLVEPTGGWFRRLIARLVQGRLDAAIRLNPTITTRTVRSQEFCIKDPKTGETKVYHGIDELPPEVRDQIKSMGVDMGALTSDSLAPPTKDTTYTVSDPSGSQQTYKSIEDMPPEMRAIFDKVRKST